MAALLVLDRLLMRIWRPSTTPTEMIAVLTTPCERFTAC